MTTDLRSPWRWAVLCLQLAFAAMCCGVGLGSLRGGDSLFSYLFLVRGWPESAALSVTHGLAYAMLAVAPLLLWRRSWPVLPLISCWIVVLAFLDFAQQPPWFELIAPERAVRYLGPLALLLLLLRRGERLAVAMLQLAAAATFAAHGIVAWGLYGPFLDLVYGAGLRIFGAEPSQAFTETSLRVIAVVDLAAALGLLLPVRRVRLAAASYMALWGLLTAASRILHSGGAGVDDALLRVPNGGVSLALLLYWWATSGSARAPQPRVSEVPSEDLRPS